MEDGGRCRALKNKYKRNAKSEEDQGKAAEWEAKAAEWEKKEKEFTAKADAKRLKLKELTGSASNLKKRRAGGEEPAAKKPKEEPRPEPRPQAEPLLDPRPEPRPQAEPQAAEEEEEPALPRLQDFAAVYLAFGAEVLHRLGCLTLEEKRHYEEALPKKERDAFADPQKKRCSFSFLSDTTTLTVVGHLRKHSKEDANVLYKAVASSVVLNSAKRFKDFEEDLHLETPLTAAAYEKLFYERCPAERKVPQPLYRTWMETLERHGDRSGDMVVNSGRFLQRLAEKAAKAWEEVLKAETGEELLKVLRDPEGLDLGNGFGPVIVARLLGLLDARWDCLNCHELGEYACFGLHYLAGKEKEEAQNLAKKKTMQANKQKEELFKKLLKELPAALETRDKHGVVEKLKKAHLFPLTAQTVEHLLCEYRKVTFPEDRKAVPLRTKTADEDWRKLYYNALPVYLLHDLVTLNLKT